MPALSATQAAAIRACVALLEAFDPDRSAAECRALLRTALECAMDATAIPKAERPDPGELIASFELRRGEES